jgi:sugar O-acyltransferase (sialic acid O-acetyltransferase NeuD family)
VFVAGTGSFAAEIADWAAAAGFMVLGLIELRDPSRVGSVRHGLPVVALEPPHPEASAVLGLGGDRREAWGALEESGWRPTTIVHPAASLARDVRAGAGVTIGPRAVVGAASVIDDHVIVSRGALIGHHVRVGRFGTLNPGVNIGGNTTIGSDAFIGMGAIVVNGVTVGERAVIGAGAVALRDVEATTRVQGIPARPVASPAAAPR